MPGDRLFDLSFLTGANPSQPPALAFSVSEAIPSDAPAPTSFSANPPPDTGPTSGAARVSTPASAMAKHPQIVAPWAPGLVVELDMPS
jgi:hypothetical protein